VQQFAVKIPINSDNHPSQTIEASLKSTNLIITSRNAEGMLEVADPVVDAQTYFGRHDV